MCVMCPQVPEGSRRALTLTFYLERCVHPTVVFLRVVVVVVVRSADAQHYCFEPDAIREL